MSANLTKYLKALVTMFAIFCATYNVSSFASAFETCHRSQAAPSSAEMGLPSAGVPGGESTGKSVSYGGNSTSSNNKYACCSPNVLKFSSKNNPCPTNQSAKLCEMTTVARPQTFSDCPANTDAGKLRKPIKFQNPAVNCDINRLYDLKDKCPIPFSRTNTTPKTCIELPNFFGMVFNTITTLGISVAMMDSFNSAVTQHHNSCDGTTTPLEGMFLDLDGMLGNTTFCPPEYVSKDQCQKFLMQGYYVDASLNGKANKALGEYASNDCKANPTNCLQLLPTGENYTSVDPCNSAPNIDKPALDCDGNILTDEFGKTLYCPLTRCNLPTRDLLAQYDDYRFKAPSFLGLFKGKNSHVDLSPGQQAYVGADPLFFKGVGLRGLKSGSKTCISMRFTFSYSTISCKPYPTPILNWPNWNFSCVSPSCQVGNVNPPQGGNTWGNYKEPATFMPITSKAMQCISETIRSIVQGGGNCNSNLLSFQNNMRDAIKAALILYVIIFGIALAIKGEMPRKSELAMFIAKFIIVIWVGTGTFNTDSNGQTTCLGNAWCPTNGLEYLYTASLALMESLPSMLMKATCDPANGDNCLCHYPVSLYAEDYTYLSLWDSLDCRINYYLGFFSPTKSGKQAFLASALPQIGQGVFGLLFGLLFSFQIMILLLMLCFTIFLLSFVLFFVNMYILCMLTVTILIYLGPIFVPMCLFSATKETFSSWLTLILGYSLQPAVLSAFIAVMIVLFDNIVYGDCIFQLTNIPSNGKPYWEIKCIMGDQGCSCPESCKYTIGYFIATTSTGLSMMFTGWPHDHPILVYPNVNAIAGMGEALLTSIWQATLFGYIFYFFSKQLANFAGDLTQSSSLGKQSISPTALIDKTGYAIKLAAKAAWAAATGDASGLQEEGEKVARSAVSGMKATASKPTASLEGAPTSGMQGGGASPSAETGAGAGVGGGGAPSSGGTGGGGGSSPLSGTVGGSEGTSSGASAPESDGESDAKAAPRSGVPSSSAPPSSSSDK